MRAIRLRIKLEILATPLYRSQNLRYPYYKEFFGYGQTFFQNVYVDEMAIQYAKSYIYDYWNQHALLAQQLALELEYATPGQVAAHQILGNLAFPESVDLSAAIAQTLTSTRDQGIGFISQVPSGLALSDGSTSYVQTFNSPINLLRLKFETGTVFKVTLESWTLPVTEGGLSVGNPQVAEPYDSENPNSDPPVPSGDRAGTGLPYGESPPPQDPYDPELDPNDFSNAPPPTPDPLPGQLAKLVFNSTVSTCQNRTAYPIIGEVLGYQTPCTGAWVLTTPCQDGTTAYDLKITHGGVNVAYPITGVVQRPDYSIVYYTP